MHDYFYFIINGNLPLKSMRKIQDQFTETFTCAPCESVKLLGFSVKFFKARRVDRYGNSEKQKK